MNVADMFASLRLNTSDFTSGLQSAVSAAKSAGKELQEALSGGGDGFKKLSESVEQSSKKAASGMKDVKRIVQGILISQVFYKTAGAIQGATTALASYNAELEQTNLAFKYLVGSQEKADRYVVAMQDLAATTPFTTSSAAQASRMLMSMGFAANQTLPILRILSDASAVSGADPETFKRIVVAMGQIKTTGRLMKQDLMQLANAGIPAFQILREELGLTQAQLDDLKKTNISSGAAINALLRGMQKRYKGASEEMSQTTKGMLNTIKDDFLIVGNLLTKGLADKTKGIIKTVRDTMETIRQTFTKTGFHGLLNKLFPPEMQMQIRVFAGYIGALANQIWQLMKALSPLTRELMHAFIITFNMAAPVILGFLNVLTKLIQVVTSSTPLVRGLALSIVWLSISMKVAAMVSRLVAAIKTLGIANFVASAVMKLSRAVKIFYVALTSHPIVAIVTIIAAGLLTLAMSSKTVTAWLDRLTASLGRLFGFKAEEMWKPLDPKDSQSNIEEFYDGLKDIGKGADDVGKKSEKAGKKVKDTFLASFDEVHTIPDALKDAADKIDSVGGLDDIKLPKMKDLKDDKDKKQQVLPEFKWPELPPFPPFPPIPKFKWPDWPPLPPLPPLALALEMPDIKAWFVDAVAALEQAGKAIQAKCKEIFQPIELPAPVIPALTPVLNVFKDFAKGLIAVSFGLREPISAPFKAMEYTVSSWYNKTAPVISTWASNTKTSIGEWYTSTKGSVGEWASNTGSTIGRWAIDTGSGIGKWCSEHKKEIGIFTAVAGSLLLLWATGGLSAIAEFVGGGITALAGFAATAGGKIAGFAALAGGTLMEFASGAGTKIATFAATAGAKIGEFGVGAWEKLSGFFMKAGPGVDTFSTESTGKVIDFATKSAEHVAKFSEGAGGKIVEFTAKTGPQVADWSNKLAGNVKLGTVGGIGAIGAFVAAAAPKIAGWVAGAKSDFISWKDNSINNIKSGSSNMLGTISGFKTQATSKFATAWNGILSNSRSTWSNLTSGFSGTGSKLTSSASRVSSAIKQSFSGMSSVVKSVFSTMGSTIGNIMAGVIRGVNMMIRGLNRFSFTTPDWLPGGMGGKHFGFNISQIPVPAFANGGIVNRDQLVRVGEGNKKEGIIPLQNARAMAPFADAVAERLNMNGNNSSNDGRPTLLVYNLIADDKGLRELNRKLKVVDIKEGSRRR